MAGTSLLGVGAAAAEISLGLEGRGCNGQRDDDGGDQLQALRRDVGTQSQRNNEAVDDAARDGIFAVTFYIADNLFSLPYACLKNRRRILLIFLQLQTQFHHLLK